MMANKTAVSKPSPYPLSVKLPPTNGVSKPPVVPARNGRSPQKERRKQNGRKTQPQLLRYGDGTPLSAENMTECNTYVRYRQAKGVVPPSKRALQQFYQQRMAA